MNTLSEPVRETKHCYTTQDRPNSVSKEAEHSETSESTINNYG